MAFDELRPARKGLVMAMAALAVSVTMLAAGALPSSASAGQEHAPSGLVPGQELTVQDETLVPADLADGEYNVGVSLTGVASIDDQTMPTVFLKDTASIKVIDGTPWLVTTLQPAYVMGSGPYYADGLYYYPEGSFTVEGKTMIVSGGQTTSQVVSYMPDPNSRFHHYPQDIVGPLPQSATTNGGYMAVAMGSSQMSSSALALKLDWSSLVQTSAEKPQIPQPQPADKAVLEQTLAFAEQISQDQELTQAYPQKAASLAQEIESVRAVQEDGSATQAKVDMIAEELNGMARAFMNADLQALYDEASEIKQYEYTAATRAELSAQLSNAKSVLGNESSTRAEVIAARDALSSAMGGLQKASVDKSDLANVFGEANSYQMRSDEGILLASEKTTTALASAISSASTVLDDDSATQSQVNDATKNLQTALNNWAKSVLEQAVATARALEQGKKTDDAFATLQTAIKSAETALNRKNAPRADNLTAAEKLRNAVSAFESSADDPTRQEGESSEDGPFDVAVKWLSDPETGQESSRMPQYVASNAIVSFNADGTYNVDFQTLSAEADDLIAAFIGPDGTAATVVSEEGASPKTYRVVVSSIEVPLRIVVRVNGMDGAEMAAYMRLDTSAVPANPHTVPDGPAETPGSSDAGADDADQDAEDDPADNGSKVPGTESPSSAATPSAVVAGTTYSAGKAATAASYEVLETAQGKSQGAVMYKECRASAQAKRVTVPATVKIEGATYKVKSIASNAFSQCKKATQATVGKNVQKIHAKAFANAPKLSRIVVKSKQLNTKKSVRNCLKRSNVKVVKVQVTPTNAKNKVAKALTRFGGKRVNTV